MHLLLYLPVFNTAYKQCADEYTHYCIIWIQQKLILWNNIMIFNDLS
jgi:hypothetical protein